MIPIRYRNFKLLGSTALAVILIMIVFAPACQKARSVKEPDYTNCLACHKGIEKISINHADLDCQSCHIRPKERRGEGLATHRGIVRNPSDPKDVDTFCLPCHKREVGQLECSLHSTMAGIINQTRYLWGAQKTASNALYGLSGPLLELPTPDPLVYSDSPERLVDDFLRRRCIRCHIHTPGPEGKGLYRATGCAACHMLYDNEGTYGGNDNAIDHSAKGYPVRHEFTRLIPSAQCLHCHNHNHVGGDYEGLFEHDYSDTYRSPMLKGIVAPPIYGIRQHHLAKDIHAQKGLWCIDCHTKKGVMGDGRLYSYEMAVPKRSCSDCHGGFYKQKPDYSIKAIRKQSNKFVFVSKDKGRRYVLSLFSRESFGHNIDAHERVRCSACHAQWSYQDYGLSVIREDMLEGYRWYGLTSQGDPYLEGILRKYIGSPGRDYPITKDRVSGEARPGIWSCGWRFRRWELMPLGRDNSGRYAILRPLYQFLITYVDRLGNIPLDSVVPSRGDGSGRGWAFMPYVPHTISPFGRQCDSCHLNGVAAGEGIQDENTIDTGLMIPSPPSIDTMRLLNRNERKKLLNPSKRWQRQRLFALYGKEITRR